MHSLSTFQVQLLIEELIFFIEQKWNTEWFTKCNTVPKGFWMRRENRRNYLEQLYHKLNLTEPSQWGKLSKEEFLSNGGRVILNIYGTVRAALVDLFPGILSSIFCSNFLEIEWKREWFENADIFPKGFWQNKKNHRKFLLELERKLEIKHPKDWGRVTRAQLIGNFGGTLLSTFGSLRKALKSAFPGFIEKFSNHQR